MVGSRAVSGAVACEAFYRHSEKCAACSAAVAVHWRENPSFILTWRMFTPTTALREKLCGAGQRLLDEVVKYMPTAA